MCVADFDTKQEAIKCYESCDNWDTPEVIEYRDITPGEKDK